MRPELQQHFGDISLLAERYDTPLVLYSEEVLVQNVKSLLGALPKNCELAYSIKANPNPGIIRILAGHGLLAEVASHGELMRALMSGIPGSRLLLGGPAKSVDAIAAALNSRASAILIESATDLERVIRVIGQVNSSINVLMRINPQRLGTLPTLKMTGVPSQFGVDEARLLDLIAACKEGSACYGGLFLYAGSQHLQATEIVANTKYLADLALRLSEDGLAPARILDFGGGFGVPEDSSQSPLNLQTLKAGLAAVFCDSIPQLKDRGLERTIFESGRYLVGTAGILVARVLDVKWSHGRRFAILDSGINHLGIRQLLYRTFEPEIEVLGRRSEESNEETVLVGPTCTPIDIVANKCKAANITTGDLIIMRDFGAYTISYSATQFCGHPWPAEVLVKQDGRHILLRRRGLPEEACGLGYTNNEK